MMLGYAESHAALEAADALPGLGLRLSQPNSLAPSSRTSTEAKQS